MNTDGLIPLRYFHAFRTKFTPRIQRKRIAPVLYPLSLKKFGTLALTDGDVAVTPR